jgi:hypothetical protein
MNASPMQITAITIEKSHSRRGVDIIPPEDGKKRHPGKRGAAFQRKVVI